MPTLFNVDIAGILGRELGPLLLPASFTKVTPGVRSGVTGGTNPTTTTHTARGFMEGYRDVLIDGTIIQRGDRKITLLGATIEPAAIPTAGDKVSIEGFTFVIIAVQRDPAAATYVCQGR